MLGRGWVYEVEVGMGEAGIGGGGGGAEQTRSRCTCLVSSSTSYLDKGGWLKIGHYTQVGADNKVYGEGESTGWIMEVRMGMGAGARVGIHWGGWDGLDRRGQDVRVWSRA